MMMVFEAKDVVVLTGVFVTLLLGIWNLFENRRAASRTRFINTVTNQRLTRADQIRSDLADFMALAASMHLARKLGQINNEEITQYQLDITKLNRLFHVIQLRLNVAATVDRKIAKSLREIQTLAHCGQPWYAMPNALSELTEATQELLKAEWERVKIEVRFG